MPPSCTGKTVKKHIAFTLLIAFFTITATGWCYTVANIGPFEVHFFDEGQSNSFATSRANWTSEQIADVGAAVGEWSDYILNVTGRPIVMHMLWEEFDGGILGGSASVRAGDGTTIYQMGEYLWREGGDFETGFELDTMIRLDTQAAGFGWNFGENEPASLDIDFRSVVAHEIGHSLGVASSYDHPYDDFGWLGDDYYGITAWDGNLVDSEGNRPVSGTTGEPDSFNETGDPVYWEGPHATAYYGGLVPIYAPDPFEPGSSLVHLDQETFPDALMSPQINYDQSKRSVTELEWAMMRDMGWSIIPEPDTAVLIFLSLGGLLRFRSKARKRMSERSNC